MEKVIKYRCSECGELFDTPEEALACETKHKRIERANVMLKHGYTLKQINDECEIWGFYTKTFRECKYGQLFQNQLLAMLSTPCL